MDFFRTIQNGISFQSDLFILHCPLIRLNVFHVVQNYLGKFKISLFYDRIKILPFGQVNFRDKGWVSIQLNVYAARPFI